MFTTYAQKQATAQKSTVSNAAVVDDRRALPVAQRVVQRVGGVVQRAPSDGKFVYFPDISGDDYKNRVPYMSGKICFVRYKDEEVKSANFSGCFMMAFKFVEEKMKSDKNSHLIFDKRFPMLCDFNATYIAHVATGEQGDAKEALFDAENRGLIHIEALFKPFRKSTDDSYQNAGVKKTQDNKMSEQQAGLSNVTGGLSRDSRGNWSAKVYSQEKILKIENAQRDGLIDEDGLPIGDSSGSFSILMSKHPEYYDWSNTERLDRRMDTEDLEFETEATKAFWYASVAVSGPTEDLRKKSRMKLARISHTALRYAIDHLSSNNDANKLMESLVDADSLSASEGASSGSGSDKAVIL